MSRRMQHHGLSVCLIVTLVSPAKTAEPIKIRLGIRTRFGSSILQRVLDQAGPGPLPARPLSKTADISDGPVSKLNLRKLPF